LWRSHLGRLYFQRLRRLQRCPVGLAFDRDRTCISRWSLSGTGGGLIGGARRFLTGRDTGGDLIDASRYLFLTGGDAVEAMPHRVDIERHCVELPIEGRRDQRDRIGSRFGL